MEKHIAGHTGKIILKTQEAAEIKAEYQTERWGKPMRAYKCQIGDHWHITTMSKGRYYTSQRKDPRTSERASNLPK